MNKVSKFLSSHKGKIFFNMAYSWGACLVILGAVFKISHFPYDNVFLMIGMVTEVTVFFITGFDNPKEDYQWEKVFPMLEGKQTGKVQAPSQPDLSGLSQEGVKKQLKELETRINSLNEIYKQQAELMAAQTASVKQLGETLCQLDKNCKDTVDGSDSIRKDICDLAQKLAQLNRVYGSMTDALKNN